MGYDYARALAAFDEGEGPRELDVEVLRDPIAAASLYQAQQDKPCQLPTLGGVAWGYRSGLWFGKEASKALAVERTEEAKAAFDELRSILRVGLVNAQRVDWEALKDQTTFTEERPLLPPAPDDVPPEPQPSDPEFVLRVPPKPDVAWAETIVDEVVAYPRKTPEFLASDTYLVLPKPVRLAISRRQSVLRADLRGRIRIEQYVTRRFMRALQEWEARKSEAEEIASTEAAERFARAKAEWVEKKRQIEKTRDLVVTQYAARLAAWAERKRKFLDAQEEQNTIIDRLTECYQSGQPQAVEQYVQFMLQRTKYPGCLPKEFRLSLIAESGVMVVDYRLPALSNLPTLKQTRYAVSRDAFEDVHHRPNEINALYDDLVYQICLRTIFEIYQGDTITAIKAVTFNGWVEFTDPATGCSPLTRRFFLLF
jgi:hypothetical protein